MKETPDVPLQVQVREKGPCAVVRIQGSVSMAQADKLRVRLEELAEKKTPVIVLDLAGMDYISSAGLGAIISAYLKSRHHSGQVRLVRPRPAVRKLLETTRLTKLFDVHDSVEQAVGA
jgi:anti-sigma B factor antagonist